MMGRQAARLFALSLCVVALPALAADSARDWFERMGKAVETLNYHGTMVHGHNNRLDTLEVVHKVENGKVYERVTSLNGSGREVIRNGDDIRCIYSDRQQVLVDWAGDESPLRSVLPGYDQSLERFYRFELTRKAGRVAGRQVHAVDIRPLDGYRYGYRLRLDAQTGMPLLCELIGEENRVIESIMFTQIEFSPDLEDDAFEPRLPTTDFEEVSAASASGDVIDSGQSHWRAEQLPDGFSLSVVTRHGDENDGAEHLVYTDGVASISVFAEKRKNRMDVIEGSANIGAANAFGLAVGDYQITAVGEVPTATVKLVGSGMRATR